MVWIKTPNKVMKIGLRITPFWRLQTKKQIGLLVGIIWSVFVLAYSLQIDLIVIRIEFIFWKPAKID